MALFESDAKMGLISYNLPTDVLSKLQSEDDTNALSGVEHSEEDFSGPSVSLTTSRLNIFQGKLTTAGSMVKRSKRKSFSRSQNFRVAVPSVDRSRSDLRNQICVMMNIEINLC